MTAKVLKFNGNPNPPEKRDTPAQIFVMPVPKINMGPTPLDWMVAGAIMLNEIMLASLPAPMA